MTRRKRSRAIPPTALVLERHPLAARYLTDLLGSRYPCRVVSVGEMLPPRLTGTRRPSVLILCNELLSGKELATLRTIRSAFPASRVLLIGDSVADEELLRFVLQGVSGIVSYNNADNELARAIQVIAEGHLWVKREVLDKLPGSKAALSAQGSSDPMRFTPRERAIMDLLQPRLSNKEIASQLGIAERTVKFHWQNAFRKPAVHDRHSASDLGKQIDLARFSPARAA